MEKLSLTPIAMELVGMHVSIVAAQLLKRTGLLKARGKVAYGTTERVVRVYAMTVLIMLTRLTIISCMTRMLSTPFKISFLGNVAFAYTLGSLIFSHFDGALTGKGQEDNKSREKEG